MPYHSGRAILHAEPKIERRLSRRVKVMMFIVLCVAMSVSAVAAWQAREAGKPTELERARADAVMTYLTEHHAGARWYGSILGVTIKDNRLYVRTNEEYLDLPVDMPNAEKVRLLDMSYARQIYQVLWDWHFEVPELEFYWVYIQNKDGNIIDGGQA